MRTKFSTQTNDEYYTPKYAVNILLPYLEQYKNKTIWCPFDKEWSNFVQLFKELNIDVKYSHIDTGQDFLTYEPDFEYDVIISNPPYSLKFEILDKCIKSKKPFCLLLPYTMFNAKRSIESVKDHIQFLMINDRISYDGSRPNFSSWYIGGNNFFEKDINYYLFDEKPVDLHRLENK